MPNIGAPELIIVAIVGLPLIVVFVLFEHSRRHEHWEAPPPDDGATPPRNEYWHRPR